MQCLNPLLPPQRVIVEDLLVTNRRWLSTISLLIILMTGGSKVAWSDASILVFSEQDDAVALAEYWTFWDDPTAEANLEAALAAHEAGAFESLADGLNRGYTSSASWLHARIARAADAPKSLYLLLDPVYLDEIDVFIQSAGGERAAASFDHFRFGDHRPVDNRVLPQSRAVMPLQLPSDRPIDVFVRIHTLSTHFLETTIATEPAVQKAVQWRLLLHGGFVAVALALSLMHFLLAFRLQDRVLAVYAGYVLTLAVGYAGIEGIAQLMLPSIAHHINDHLVGFGTGVSFSVVAWLIMVLFDTHSQHRFIHRFLQSVLVLGLVVFAATGYPFYASSAQLLFVAGLVFVFVAFWLAWVHYRQGDPAGRLFLVAFSVSGIGATVSFMRILGLLPVNVLTQYAVQMSSFVHMILMALALSERVLAAEENAKQALRDAENNAMDLADQMTEKLAKANQNLEKTLTRERELRKEQSDFIDTISHEYRTPLSVLRTNVDILRGRGQIDEERFSVMSKALRRLAGIFTDAMDTHRMGHPPRLALRRVDLAQLLNELIVEFRETHPNCPVHLTLSDVSMNADVDQRMMRLIMLNLLENADKYRLVEAQDSGVSVHLSAGNSILRIVVVNAVNPSALDDRKRLLERFVRGEKASSQVGSGLGLYLVKQGIEQMGGSVTIDESSPHQFRVTLTLSSVNGG